MFLFLGFLVFFFAIGEYICGIGKSLRDLANGAVDVQSKSDSIDGGIAAEFSDLPNLRQYRMGVDRRVF